MRFISSIALISTGILSLSGCSLPQGAARSSQILSGAATTPEEARELGIAVVHVSRNNVGAINTWASSDPGELRRPWPGAAGAGAAVTLAPGDQIMLRIWDNDPNALINSTDQKSTELNGLKIATDGSVTLPYAGKVKIAGLSEDAALNRLREEVRKTQPTAEVQLATQPGRLNSVAAVSGVASPGSYPLPEGGLPVLSLIALSGGVQPGLQNPVVRLIRGKVVYETRADDLLQGRAPDVMLRGGDRVAVVEDQRRFTMLGATGSEQLMAFDRAQITALQALAKSGGLASNRADLKGVLVLRDYAKDAAQSGGPTAPSVIYALDLTSADGLFAARTFDIHPGDTVLVTESPVVSARAVLGLVGSVFGINNQLQ
ncbi:MAG TPA: polysaccharide biosynthesis/export family protein [Paenirhodobacter sp.]